MPIFNTWKSNLAMKPAWKQMIPLGASGTCHFPNCCGDLRMKMMKTEGPSAFFAGAIPRCVQVQSVSRLPVDPGVVNPPGATNGTGFQWPLTMPVS